MNKDLGETREIRRLRRKLDVLDDRLRDAQRHRKHHSQDLGDVTREVFKRARRPKGEPVIGDAPRH